MIKNYFSSYLKSINHPLPELKKTFKNEIRLIKSEVNKRFIILDVGCGAGRPTNDLAKFVNKIIGVDNHKEILNIAKKRSKGIKNLEFKKGNALYLNFPKNTFNFSYSTYNTIGGIEKSKRNKMIKEMVRVTKEGGKILNITWKNNKFTTKFLKKYYPNIGVKIIKIDRFKTTTSKRTFHKLSRKELLKYYEKNKLKRIKFVDINPLWLGAIGTK